MAHQQHRIYTFDLLRGIAVITMMLAHSVYFFTDRSSDFLVSTEGFGNTVSFVTFLLVSGAVAAVAYGGDRLLAEPGKRKRIFIRVLLLLLAYYVLALVLVGADLLRAEGFARLRIVFDILSFRHLPGFTEYFPPFIFYSALLALVPRWFWIASRTVINLIVVSAISMAAGFALSYLSVGAWPQPWVALVAGGAGLYRFPLLQYLPVFLLGLYWGQQTLASEGLRAKAQLCWRFFWLFAFLALAAYLGSFLLRVPVHTMFLRWPPAVPFLALGLGFAFLVAALLYAVRQLRRVALLRDLLLMFGQNALGLFWSHIFLLGLYAAAGGPKVSSPGLFLFLWLLLVLLSLAITTFLPFNFRLALTRIRGSHEEYEEELGRESVFRLSQDVAAEAAVVVRGLRRYFLPNPRTTSGRVLKTRHQLGILLIVLTTAVLLYPPTIQEIVHREQQQGAGVWWSDRYAYRQQLTIQNSETFITIQPDTPVAMRFNHKKLVAEGKSRADGLDVQLVYWDGHDHVLAASSVANPNTDQATLEFLAPVKIQAGKREQFYTLYYGGFVSSPSPGQARSASATILADFSAEEVYPLVAKVSKSWYLIGEAGGDTVTFQLTAPTKNTSRTATYQVLGTDLSGPMSPGEAGWEADVPVATLPPGAYRIQATLHDGLRVQTSQETGFYRSHPLYVAWTQDWEGYDANPAYLDAIEAIANHYHLPITHFFNPRIYVTKTISAQRAKTLTQWVQRRIGLGDGYGLHLHMFTDYIEYAGVVPRTEPNWGDSGDGYGVPLTAYTPDEQKRMIETGRDLMVANGFGRTDMFRAGGWFNDLNTLAALEDLGFSVDSSARTTYKFGRNQLPGHWNIFPTTKPYHPSRTNQNLADPVNGFTILEVPDNGADSYAYSAQQMIDRFTANLGSGLLNQPQQLTYLSHPHWFDQKEQSRVRELFSRVSQSAFSNDRGPVIFTTTKEIANIFTHAE